MISLAFWLLLLTLCEEINTLPVLDSMIRFTDLNASNMSMTRSIYLNNYVPVLSSELTVHYFKYKPRSFSIKAIKLSENKALVEFNYSYTEPFSKYSFRIRYHNHLIEYTTNMSFISPREPNRVILNHFPHAAYVVCVTLHPSMTAYSQFHPISTSDMCVDVVFGPEHSFTHSKTGLLMPVLLGLVFIHLVLISIISRIQKTVNKKKKAKKSSKQEAIDKFNNIMETNKDQEEAMNLAKKFSFYQEETDDYSYYVRTKY